MLRIRVPDLPEGQKILEEVRPLSWLEGLLHGHGEDFVRPSGPLSFRLNLTRSKRQVTLKGEIQLAVDFTCSRCSAEGHNDLQIQLNDVFVPAPNEAETATKKALDLSAEDFASQTYDNNEIDLGRYLADSILLAFPAYPRCPDEQACCEGAADYNEDWGEEEAMPRNPAWQEGLARAKKKLKLRK